MVNSLLHLFNENRDLAFAISIFISILIAILAVVPSVFITAANILFFGFWNGLFISFLGEAIGAGVAFILYRKGFKKRLEKGLSKYPKLKLLINAQDKQAFYLIFSLRLIPFIPSGLISFAAAVGRVSLLTFFIASSLGKLPALLIESYSVFTVIQFNWQGKLVLVISGVALLYGLIKKSK